MMMDDALSDLPDRLLHWHLFDGTFLCSFLHVILSMCLWWMLPELQESHLNFQNFGSSAVMFTWLRQ